MPAYAPQTSSLAYPSASTGAMTLDSMKQWLAGTSNVPGIGPTSNKALAGVGAAVLVGGLAYYGHKKRWF